MSLLTKLKYLNINIIKGYNISFSARFANKKIDPFFEKEKSNKTNKTNNKISKSESESDEINSIKTKSKKFNFFEIFSLAFGIGICSYVIYLIIKKREESI